MSVATSSTTSELDREEIIAHLRQILADRRFASAERNARFLRYVVETTLDGKASEIKETVIASEVYGRSSDYDPKADSIVRVEASRLRQKLRSYYENEGKTAGIRINLPSGSYVPSFERVSEAPPQDIAPIAAIVEPSEGQPAIVALSETYEPARKKPWLVVGGGIFLLAALLLIQLNRSPKPATSQDAEALAAWQEGVALMELDPHTAQTISGPPKTVLRAIERLEFSVARNPLRAQTWATLAEAYDYASSYSGRDLAEDARRMEAASRRAIALDDKLSSGHHMLGLLLKGIKWDLPQAEVSYRRALALDPRNAYAAIEYADLLWETGRISEAAEEIRKARALLPAFPALAVKEAEIQLEMGRIDAAMVTAQSAIEMKRTYSRAHLMLGMVYEKKGQYQEALSRYEHVLKSNPSDRRALPAYGYLLGKTGQLSRAREIAAQLEKLNANVRNCAFQVAVVYAGIGEDELAIDWLERAWRTRQALFPHATAEYRLRRFHNTPRFRELLNRTGLKPFFSNSAT